MKKEALPLESFAENLRTVFEYWRSLGGEDLKCAWSQFDLLAIPKVLLPSTMIVDVGVTMEENRYRYWGSQMTRIYGSDMTGKSPYDIVPTGIAEAVYVGHSDVIKNKQWVAYTFEFIRASGVEHRQSTLMMPLSDDENTVNQIVNVVDLSQSATSDKKGLLSGFPT